MKSVLKRIRLKTHKSCTIEQTLRLQRTSTWMNEWITYIFKMRISFFAALRTFLPSFFRNFLHVYIFIVVLSLALNISQNSSLKRTILQDMNRSWDQGLLEEKASFKCLCRWCLTLQETWNTHDLTIWPRSYLSVTSEGLL